MKKGAIRKVQPSKGEFVRNLFLVKNKDEGRGPKTSDKMEATNCIYPISPLQNGRFEKSEIYVAKRGLHMQTRLKRCIFFGSLGKKFKAICSPPLVRKLVRVPLPLLWFEISTTIFTKLLKVPMTVLRRINIKYRRRHAVNWSLFKRDAHELRHGNLPSATSRICHELEKSCVDTSAGNRVLEPDNQLCHSRTFIKQNKNSESSSRM